MKAIMRIRSYIPKAWMIRQLLPQILFVTLAFAVMVAASYVFVSNIERGHLATEARSALNHLEAIIGLDAVPDTDKIRELALEEAIGDRYYNIILDAELNILAHPDPEYVGAPVREYKTGLANLADEFERDGNISERVIESYRGEMSVLFARRLENGWYVCAVTPVDKYYENMRNMQRFLIVLGVAMATALSVILARGTVAKMRAEERMQAMFNATPLCANFWNRDLKNIDTNDEAVKLFQLSSKQEYIDRFHELSPEYQPGGMPSRDMALEQVKKAFDEGYCRFEWMHQKLDGESIPCEITLVRVNCRGDYIVAGYTRDLREHKKLMETLEHRDFLLNTVYRVAGILLSVNDEESIENSLIKSMEIMGRCVNADRVQILRGEAIGGVPHFVRSYGWTGDTGERDITTPECVSFPQANLPNWKEGLPCPEYLNVALSVLSPEEQVFLGRYGIKAFACIPLFFRDQFWGILSLENCRDERLFTEEEISVTRSAALMMLNAINRNTLLKNTRRDSERVEELAHWYWSILDAIPMPISVIDTDMNWTFINTALADLLKTNRGDLLGRHCGNMNTKICKTDNCGVARAKQGFQRTYFTDGEASYLVNVEILKNMDDHDAGFVEIVQDITKIETMARKQAEAEAANRAKSTFLANVSHEIRTPLNVILGLTEIHLMDHALPGDVIEAFNGIHSAGDTLLRLVNDILDLSKIDTGKLELVPAHYDVAILVHDSAQMCLMSYDSKPVEFELNIDANIPAILFGDELRIKQILYNLLSNAFKYTTSGKIALSISRKPMRDEEGRDVMLIIRVHDTGQGMTGEQLSKLFEEYTRFNMKTNRSILGAGLGMSITRNLVWLMDGEISVESEPAQGSVFTVRLPQRDAGAGVLGQETVENLRQFRLLQDTRKARFVREPMPYGKVLIVDDMGTNLRLAQGLMLPYGLSIDTAKSGFDAIEKVKAGNVYDIVFMDHMMPKMDGIETVKIMRGMGYKHPIVALTANAVTGQAEIFMENGFDGFISKPIDVRELNVSLNKFIRDKQRGPSTV